MTRHSRQTSTLEESVTHDYGRVGLSIDLPSIDEFVYTDEEVRTLSNELHLNDTTTVCNFEEDMR